MREAWHLCLRFCIVNSVSAQRYRPAQKTPVPPCTPSLPVSASLSQQKWKCVGMLHASFQHHLNGPFSISHQGVLQGAGSGYQNSFYRRIRTN